jgi:hypothetical protein
VLEGLTYLYDVHRIIHRGMSHDLTKATRLTCRLIHHQTSSHPTSYATPKAKSKYVILVFQENSSIRSQILSSGRQLI